MGVLIQIRDVDETVRDTLKARAAAEGVSMNTFLQRLLIDSVAQPTRADVLARIAKRAERAEVSSAGLIREARDARSPLRL